MNIEKIQFEHFKNIEELIQHLEMWYADDDVFAYEKNFHLRDARIMGMYIYQLEQENKQLKNNWKKLKEFADISKELIKKIKEGKNERIIKKEN